MNLLPTTCNQCNRIFFREKRRINESKKFKWKTYCSSFCESKSRNKQQVLKCSNLKCQKEFKRQISDIHNPEINYCSRSCAASLNNVKFPKRQAIIKECFHCGNKFSGKEKYCSVICKNKDQLITKNVIISDIKKFFKLTGRIPLKREFHHVKAARNRFGTWNKAVIAAGYASNTVRFSKKYIANDNHKCDSLAEKIIDDWLYARKIPHERSIPYHKNNMTADFRVGNVLIEFFGLKGAVKSYDTLIAKKKKLWKEKGLKVIEIYPEHLFPKNKLADTLKF